MEQQKKSPQQFINPIKFGKAALLKSKFAPLVMILVISASLVGFVVIGSSSKKNTSPNLSASAQNNLPSAPPQLARDAIANPHPTPQTHPTTPTPTLTPLPTLNPGTSWDTYTNAKYNYSIKYPPDWIVRDLSPLEPKVPSYIVFNPITASQSSRFITISINTRTYQEQISLGGQGTPFIAAGIKGIKQMFQDSNGLQSTAIVLPRTNDLLIPRAKINYESIFYIMLSTLTTTK